MTLLTKLYIPLTIDLSMVVTNMPTVNKVAMLVGGIAGAGVVTVGTMLSKCFQRCGLYVFAAKDYPSLIRGGHNFYVVRAEDEPISCHLKTIDVVIAFNKETVIKHFMELNPGGAIIYDGEKIKLDSGQITRPDIRLFSIPLERYAKECGGELYFNVVAMASGLGLVKMDLDIIRYVLEKMFGRKGPAVVEANMKAAKMGYEDILKQCSDFKNCIEPLNLEGRIYVSGNEAACMGAIKAGVKLVAEYPMTPSSSVLHFMADHEETYNIVVKHTEDEIAAMNMVVAAGFAGVRALTATSGGGFSLMVEAIGMAGIMEAPCVILESQRCGPSTGLPTYQEQADLRFIMHASQGEFPRIVLTPGDMHEAFYETERAFNMAEMYQVPVLVVLDKFISESNMTIDVWDMNKFSVNRGKLMTNLQMQTVKDFKRYQITSDGISPRSIPGQPNGLYTCSSYEHDESSWTTEEADMRVKQIDKRARKLLQIPESEIAPVVFGDKDALITLVGWGSTLLVAKEAIKFLNRDGIKARYIHYRCILPFPLKSTQELLSKPGKYCVIEGNSTAQLRGIIREFSGVYIQDTYLRYDGRPFDPEDIYVKVMGLRNG